MIALLEKFQSETGHSASQNLLEYTDWLSRQRFFVCYFEGKIDMGSMTQIGQMYPNRDATIEGIKKDLGKDGPFVITGIDEITMKDYFESAKTEPTDDKDNS